MCGRFTLAADLDLLIERFNIAETADFEYGASFNIAPSQQVAAIIMGEDGRKLGPLKWGLVPHWAKSPDIGYKMINARAETAAEKPSYRDSLKKRRCLIPADGFYEWKKTGDGKIPQRIIVDDGDLFAFAGLWSIWRRGHDTLATCTILTTAANPLMKEVHDRMPVILEQKDEDKWLDPEASEEDIQALLKGYDPGKMSYYEVSAAVNKPANNDKTLIKPVS